MKELNQKKKVDQEIEIQYQQAAENHSSWGTGPTFSVAGHPGD